MSFGYITTPPSRALLTNTDTSPTTNAQMQAELGKAVDGLQVLDELAQKYTRYAIATGSANVITAAFTPTISALTDGMRVTVRAIAANTTTTPTFKADSTTAYTIVKGNGVALLAGDIAGSGHILTLEYDSATFGSPKWVLINPAYGVTPPSYATTSANGVVKIATGSETYSENTLVHTTLSMRAAFNASGAAPVYACRAWVNFNGSGTIAIKASGNVSSITDNGVGDYSINLSTAMPDANYAVSGMAASISSAFGKAYLLMLSGTTAKTSSVVPIWAIGVSSGSEGAFDPTDATVIIHR